MKVTMYTDGGARGNPGLGGIGIVIMDLSDNVIYEVGKTIGKCTNNEAEYTALIEGLTQCLALNITEVDCKLDSELVVKQLNKEYKVKDERMAKLYAQVLLLKSKFTKVTFTHVLRTQNKRADKLYNDALDLIS